MVGLLTWSMPKSRRPGDRGDIADHSPSGFAPTAPVFERTRMSLTDPHSPMIEQIDTARTIVEDSAARFFNGLR
jgi:hypothetical protein